MDIPLTQAGVELADLVTRAESGEDIVLTRDGVPVARLTPVPDKSTRHALMAEHQDFGATKNLTAAPAGHLGASPKKRTYEEKMAFLLEIQKSASAKALPGPDAAHSQDFLYGDDGLPA